MRGEGGGRECTVDPPGSLTKDLSRYRQLALKFVSRANRVQLRRTFVCLVVSFCFVLCALKREHCSGFLSVWVGGGGGGGRGGISEGGGGVVFFSFVLLFVRSFALFLFFLLFSLVFVYFFLFFFLLLLLLLLFLLVWNFFLGGWWGRTWRKHYSDRQ